MKSSNQRIWKILAAFFILLSVALLIAVIVLAVNLNQRMGDEETTSQLDKDRLEATQKIPTPKLSSADQQQSERGNSVYSGLTDEEVQQVISFLLADQELELSPAAEADVKSNYIYTVEDYLPEKEEAIRYLNGENKEVPERKARVILYLGKNQTVLDLLVWPIPNPQNKMEIFFNRPEGERISWKSRAASAPDDAALKEIVYAELDSMSQIIRDSFTPGCQNWDDCLMYGTAIRAVLSSPRRHMLTWFFKIDEKVEEPFLYSLPLFMVFAATEDGNYAYEAVKFYYNAMAFDTREELIAAYSSNSSIRYEAPDVTPNINGYDSPRYIERGGKADHTRHPPTPILPDGQRFSVSGRYVKWLDWSFNIHYRTVSGIQMFDVRFNDERIAYELSMQDILVLYSGSDVGPDNFFKSYFDVGWALGLMNTPLIRGVDCPPGAMYLNGRIYALGGDAAADMTDGVCIFEQRNSVPLRRHYGFKWPDLKMKYAFSMPDSALVVRQIVTVANYDYIFDYEFHQNGVVELKVSSTGYIAVSTDLRADSIKKGYLVNPQWNAVGNLHQHLFNFKMDIDIDGVSNRFKTVDLTTEQVETEFSGSNAWSQMIIEETLIENERDALVRYDFSKPKQYIVFNENSQVYPDSVNPPTRGYKIFPNGLSKVVLSDDTPLLRGGASWSKYQVAVTKHNDNEGATASYFVQGDPFNPAVSFDRFVENNDSLVDSDLVVWATVGLHHSPTYEDLPVTTTSGKVLSVSLIPFNFFERDPSIHSRDAVLLWSKALYEDREDELLKFSNDTCAALPLNPTVAG